MKKLLTFLLLITLTSCTQKEDPINLNDYYREYFYAETDIPIYDEEHNNIGHLLVDNIYKLDEFNNEEYFKLNDLPYYIHYLDITKDAEPYNSYINFNNYIEYNDTIITNNSTELYNLDNKLIYSIDESIEINSIIIKENDYYTIKYNDVYYKLPTTSIAQEISNEVTEEVAEQVPVLMYHFFYSAENGEKSRDNNWLEVNKFEEHLKYLTENDFHILSMSELEHYLNGEVLLPKKSVVITIDDGDPSVYTYAYPLLEKYNVKATTFLITSWYHWDIENRVRDFIELHSHSNNMHQGGCNIKHGGLMMCIDYDKGVEDLKTSQELLYGSFVYCYPFGDVDERAKDMLTDAGFRLAFTTKSGKVKPGMDLLELPRMRISNEMSFEQFKSIFK